MFIGTRQTQRLRGSVASPQRATPLHCIEEPLVERLTVEIRVRPWLPTSPPATLPLSTVGEGEFVSIFQGFDACHVLLTLPTAGGRF